MPAEPFRINPYVGPRSFRTGEKLYGRDREVEELLDLLIAERIVLLYSPSGAGKSSLVQAALIPRLEEEGFRVRPVMRVSQEAPAQNGWRRDVNRYIFSALLSLEEALPDELELPLDALAGLDLPAYLQRSAATDDEHSGEVLIFDQFEEILTVNPADHEIKAAFFAQVGQALRDRERWALFAMREDYIAGLDRYLRPIPTRLGNTFRLDLLEEAAARAAMQRPARRAGLDFTDAAALRLANDLRKVRVQRADGSTEETLGPYVEPVQLQVVCYRLWDGLPAEARQIVEADVEAVGNVDTALSDYYAERVASAARETGVSERAIRDWCERQLITGQGIRGQVLQGPEQGLDRAAIQRLLDAYLVRAEKRRGATWFELAHDRLIEPVQKNNAAWREAHLSALQRQADLWEKQDRPDGLLLRSQALIDAERWAEANAAGLTETEHDFLDACRKARAATERERRNNRLIRVLAIAALVGLIAAIIATISATQSAGEADRQARIAQTERAAAVVLADGRATAEANRATAEAIAMIERDTAQQQYRIALSRQLAAQALSLVNDQLDLSLLLSLQAYRTEDTFEARSSLLTALQHQPRLTTFLAGHQADVLNVTFSSDGKTLAVIDRDANLSVWDASDPQAPARLGRLPIFSGALVDSVAFSWDHRMMALSGSDEAITLWDISNPESPVRLNQPLAEYTGAVNDLIFSPAERGKTLVSSDWDGAVIIWDVSTPQLPVRLSQLPEEYTLFVTNLAFSPDGRTLATAGESQAVWLWDVANPASPVRMGELSIEFSDFVRSLAFSPDGRTLAVASDVLVSLWDVSNPRSPVRLGPPFTGEVAGIMTSLAFSPAQRDGATLASANSDGRIILWDVSQPRQPPRQLEVLAGHAGAVNKVAFSPDGKTLVSGGDDARVILWNVSDPRAPAVLGTRLSSRQQSVLRVTFEASGPDNRFAAGYYDGLVTLWDASDAGAPIALGQLEFDAAQDIANNMALSPRGDLLVVGSPHRISLWDISEPQSPMSLGQSIADPDGGILAVVFSRDGKRLALGSASETISLWDVSDPRLPARLSQLQVGEGLGSMAFSPDDTILYGSGSDAIVSIDVSDPQSPVLAARIPTLWRTLIALSPDGRLLASNNPDNAVTLWDVSDAHAPAQLGQTVIGHTASVRNLTFSPAERGARLATGGEDRAVIVWDVSNPEAPARLGRPLAGHATPVNSVAFSTDGKTIASGSDDGAVILWDVDFESWQARACRIANRNLTAHEWKQYLKDEPYHKTCEQWPEGQ